MTLLGLGLRVNTPLKWDGTLKLPPKSVPIEKGTHLVATRAASPPDDPPQLLS